MLDLAIHLRQRLFTAHGQNRVAKGHQDSEQAQHRGQLRVPKKPRASLLKCRLIGVGHGGRCAPTWKTE